MNKVFLIKKEFLSEADSTEKLAAVNRINALACIMAARHGWIGATFSCADIVTSLYSDHMDVPVDRPLDGDLLILSKGHAAPIQYACLAAKGVIPFESLLEYKTRFGPQAHTDINTPGIAVNTGSLGQSLSKACGIALADRLRGSERKIFVIIGDGEMQEGQIYEALMTLKKYSLTSVIPVIDCNRLQTDSPVGHIMETGDLEKVFQAFGFRVIKTGGHNMNSLNETFSSLDYGSNNAVIADTVKGFGTSLTSMPHDTAPGEAVWHSQIPGNDEYLEMLGELVEKTGSANIRRSFEDFRKSFEESSPAIPPAGKSTRDYFSEIILGIAEKNRRVVLLDADLAKSLKLTGFMKSHPERFIETGISEQDMVSAAGGLALGGIVPVVNTYASFFRRAFEQIYVNATEKTLVVYAGSYSGLCYPTDGKTHQMTGDVAMMKSIPSMRVYDPFCREELEGILEYYLSEGADAQHPVYIRLRRSPADYPVSLPEGYSFKLNRGVELRSGKGACFVTAGPQMASYALKAAGMISGSTAGVVSFSAQNYLDAQDTIRLLERFEKIITLEESVISGGLGDEISSIMQAETSVKVIRKGIDDFTFSCRDKSELYKRFALDPVSIFESLGNTGG